MPRTGPVIIAGNHVSFADEIFTPVAARRQVFYFAKAEYFNTPGIKGRSMAALFRAMRQLPVERGDTRSAAASLDVGLEVLQGRAGARHLSRGHPLTGRAALQVPHRRGPAGAALGRAGRAGRPDRHPRRQAADRAALARRPLAVHFGPALDFSGRAADERSARTLREVTEQIRRAVQELSGQEYVDAYASTAKSRRIAVRR